MHQSLTGAQELRNTGPNLDEKYSPSSGSENVSGKLDPLEGLKKEDFVKFVVTSSEI